MWRAILTLVGAAVLVGLAWVVVDRMMECGVTQHASLTSPGGSKQAVLFDVDCGATTGFNTQVAIAPMNTAFDREETLPVLVMNGRWSLPIRWIDDRTLHIRIPKDARFYKKLTSAGDVLVTYQDDENAARRP